VITLRNVPTPLEIASRKRVVWLRKFDGKFIVIFAFVAPAARSCDNFRHH
jgi:hypothetical protein